MAHVLANDLRNAVSQAAIQGKLTQQLKTDQSIDKLLESIKNEKEKLVKEKKIKKEKSITITKEDEVLFEIPNEWRWVSLQSISKKIFAGGDKPKIFTSEPTEENIYPVIANSKLNDGILGYTNSFTASECTITMAARGSNVGLTTFRPYKYLPIVRLIVIELMEGINPQYLQIALSVIGQTNTGSAIPQITVPMLINKFLPLPPIEEQQRIVERVEELMDKIDEYEKIEKQLVELKKEIPGDMRDAILQAAMEGKLTERLESDSNIDTYVKRIKDNNSILKSNKNVLLQTEEIPFDIPNDWCWVRIKDISSYKNGFSFKSTDYCTTGIQVVRITDLSEDGVLEKNAVYYPKTDSLENYLIKKHSILICMTGSIGKMSLINDDKPRYLNQRVVMLSIINDVLTKFVWYYLHCNHVIMGWQKAKTSTNGNIKTDDIVNLYIPLPPIEEQQRIVEILDKLLPLCDGLVS